MRKPCSLATTRLCVARDFRSPWFAPILDALHLGASMHRKYWEFVSIVHALEGAGPRGIGFGVGTEPLTSYFASVGRDVLATDLCEGGVVWASQHAGELDAVHNASVCGREAFLAHAHYRNVDMTEIPQDLACGEFDFAWSSSSLEHLGSAGAGEEFIRQSLRCLRPGGIAAHTTEFNVSEDVRRPKKTSVAVYCRSDVEKLLTETAEEQECDWWLGDEPADAYIDRGPYTMDPHLKLELSNTVITSILVVLRKAREGA